jgi:heme oxygenase
LTDATWPAADGRAGEPGPPLSVRPAPRRERLRAATAALHADLEARSEAAGHFDGIEGYRRYLRRMLPLYAALECALDTAAPPVLADWARRAKVGAIRADLAALDADAPAEGPVPLIGVLARPWGPGTALGVLYVLEGATLGGAVLARRMAAHGLTRERGGRFLDPYGPARGALWRGFLAALEDTALPAAEEATLPPAAAAAFGLFASRLDAPAR